ncbi:IclR family transcriptional regulator C-terminal domain-containing protein [Desulfococcaceae bacterium HSG9]|nr:IclR family transcriptional regulator C-terminal domain-containing protein [Desulfococcaceae bacterium HSG9]
MPQPLRERAMCAGMPKLKKCWKKIKSESFTSYTITDKKLFMEEMERIKKKGYAQTNQELILGWQNIAVPNRKF